MADNYLERKFEEFRNGGPRKSTARRSGASLDTLLLRNRSYRGYDKSHTVHMQDLKTIVAVNTRIPSARNQQSLRFKLVTRESGADRMLNLIRLGGALSELHLPLPGTEPEAFIIICSTNAEYRWTGVDVGISAQSMLLKAVEMGLGGICIGAFNKEKVIAEFGLDCEPMLILAIGKPAETIQLKPINASDDHDYYRKEGIHYVPKVIVDDLIM